MLLRTAGWARIRDESNPTTNARQCGGTIALADMSIKMTPSLESLRSLSSGRSISSGSCGRLRS